MLGGSEKWTIPISRVRRAENWARRRRRFRRGGVPLFVQASTSVFPAWPSSTTTRVRYFLFSSEPFPPDRCSSQNWREGKIGGSKKKRENLLCGGFDAWQQIGEADAFFIDSSSVILLVFFFDFTGIIRKETHSCAAWVCNDHAAHLHDMTPRKKKREKKCNEFFCPRGASNEED